MGYRIHERQEIFLQLARPDMLQGPPSVLSSGHRRVLLQEYYLQDHGTFYRHALCRTSWCGVYL